MSGFKSAHNYPSQSRKQSPAPSQHEKQRPAMEYKSVASVSTSVPSQFSAGQTHSPTTGRQHTHLSWHQSLVPAFLHAWPPHPFHPWSAPGRLSKMCSRLAGEQVVKAHICKKNDNRKQNTTSIMWQVGDASSMSVRQLKFTASKQHLNVVSIKT